MKITSRFIHRNLAYFYFGLLISFAFSGILNNHKDSWQIPVDYTYQTKNFNIPLPVNKLKFKNKKYVKMKAQQWYPKSTFLGYRIRNNSLRAFYKDNTIIDMDLEYGMGEIEYRRKVPVLGHAIFLHKSSNNFWVWYSDIFALSIITIAIAGILIPKGKNSFKKQGWKIALAGLIFPLLFLFLFA